ncbi:hypothetical protein ACHAWF_015992 [Thalassiosira exigua]
MAYLAAFSRPCAPSGALGTNPRPARRSWAPRAFAAVSDAATSSSSFVDPSSLPASAAAGITPIKEFEPVLNVEAAASFALIAVAFALLQIRIGAVSGAATRRSAALEALRRVESLRLSDDAPDRPTEGEVARAKREYEVALREEMRLRTVAPGVRIAAPNDPRRDEEERAAARRFLGWGSEEFGDNVGEGSDPTSENSAGLSAGTRLLLFGVASMLIVLLWALTFDPMVADQVFTTM